ncbi:MAG: SPOR domain-containing protein [Candidatus Eisenbacteria bacterium]|nr:SPOR domain-containing protein [Candidatus Eisenbacteria bacterium]
MRYFASAEEMSSALSLPILLRVDVDSRFLERHDRLSGYAADRPHAGRIYHRALAQTGAKGWNGKTVWVTGPWGSLEHLPWAIGFAQVAADEGARAFLFAPGIDLPLIEKGGAGEQLWSEMTARLAPLGGEGVVAFSTDLAGVRVLAPGSGNRAGSMGEPCLVFAESLPESLTGPYRGPEGIDGVILVAGFRDHGVYELESVARGLADSGHQVLGIVAVGPAATEDAAQSRGPQGSLPGSLLGSSPGSSPGSLPGSLPGSSQSAALAARSPMASAGPGEGLLGATRARSSEPAETRPAPAGGDVWGRRPGRGSGKGPTPATPPVASPGERAAEPAPGPKPLEAGSLLSQAQAKQEVEPASPRREGEVTSSRVEPVPARPEGVRPPESPSFVAGQEAAARVRAEEVRQRAERDAKERAAREAARETAARLAEEKAAAEQAQAALAQAAQAQAEQAQVAQAQAAQAESVRREAERVRAARPESSPRKPDPAPRPSSRPPEVATVAPSRSSRREAAEQRREEARARTAAGQAAGAVPLLARWEEEATRERRVRRFATGAALLVLAALVVVVGLPVAKRKGWVPAGAAVGSAPPESTATAVVPGAPAGLPNLGAPAGISPEESPRTGGGAGFAGAADSGRGVPRAAGLEEDESGARESTRVARPNPAVPRDFPWGEPKRAGVATDSARAPRPEHRSAEVTPSAEDSSGASASAQGLSRPSPGDRASGAQGAGPPAVGERTAGDYVVHLSSFRLEREAQSEVSSLAGQGIRAEYLLVDVADRGPWYRVVTGRFATFGEAETMAMRLCRMKGVPRTHVVGQGGRGEPVPVDSLAGVPAAARPRMD